MNKSFITSGIFSILIGIITLFTIKLFTAYLELTKNVGIEDIETYNLNTYATYFFVIGVILILSGLFINKLKKF
ncbi:MULTISPECIES: hypothetical protein [unclassified Exiguobacterium]|jgi:uncharacterized membrane protein HdeD (DUF308 family)|uniref:hypothetical protein n=1 Tax=unclassified Exiguobacterium TaxID=2644629 RepID=UPI0006FE2742|nr:MULTISPECIES: hypothetical protein [unclassified Exiguobacterium]KQS37693.1 hypothetical protein ASG02_12005 [Exiguobacterium sp. Leaf196]